MYPETRIEVIDQSAITQVPTAEQVTAPLFMQVFSSDKGPEEWGTYYGDTFKIFGDASFARHGQPLLQAYNAINNGAKIMAKRVVAPDSTLANIIIKCKISKESTQKTDAEGNLIYVDTNGDETTTADGNNPVMIDKAVLAFIIETVTDNKNDLAALRSSAFSTADFEGKAVEEEAIFPLFVIAENGRGVSGKKVRITTDTNASKTVSYVKYALQLIEGTTVKKSMLFSFDPDVIYNNENISFQSVLKASTNEIRGFMFEEAIEAMLEKISKITGITRAQLSTLDVLFGKDKKGVSLSNVIVKRDVDISSPSGIPLASGSNGSFGTKPTLSEDYSKEIVKAFNGEFSDDIYDIDNVQLDGVIDAGYSAEVKRAIEDLVKFRGDAMFFRDSNTDVYTIEDAINIATTGLQDCCVESFGNFYDIKDPYTKKQITVTIGYSLARILPNHFNNGRNLPLAGQAQAFTFPEIIPGTLNITPKKLPSENQKEKLFDARVNFLSYLDGVATMESEFTTNPTYTGLSFANNVLAVQQIIKVLRARCPRIRYAFMEQDDLRKYKEDIESQLAPYKSYFSKLEMVYGEDENFEKDNTFYAMINVVFKKFVQSEYFKIFALNE